MDDKTERTGTKSTDSVKTLLHFSDGIMEIPNLDSEPTTTAVTHSDCDPVSVVFPCCH